MSKKLILKCPVRGVLKASRKSKDGLTPSEEYFRVEAIKYLIANDYPAENIKIEPIVKKFGNSGRNSFRSDFAVLDVPVDTIDTSDVDVLLEHALILCEVKRDNAKSDYVKNTQVKPMLDFAKLDKCLGLYWDNIEQRVFWQEVSGGKRDILEGPLTFLPSYGDDIQSKPITFHDTTPSDSLIEVFERIEDILHQASFDPEKRYEIILQLLLAKIFDEHAFEGRPDQPMAIQDFSVLGTPPNIVKDKFEKLLKKATTYYEKHLPNKVPSKTPLSPDTIIEILKIIAPIRITHSKRDIIQTFYMKFAKDLYRWDLAQFFTPTAVTDFIVDIINPQFGDHVCDPACGSADFLVAAFHVGRQYNHGYADCIWGVDNSANAVQISVLNMVLNGDGKSNISKDDSLEAADKNKNKYDIMLCNPPFGTRIVEKRSSVLRNYELGKEWVEDGKGGLVATSKLLSSQETGILFAEVCVKQARKENGRIGIILPNGYLGNRSHKYRVFREWLLKNCKLVGMVSFPRFTFKTSGADVSASVLFLEKREEPLKNLVEEDFEFFVELIENLGWEAGNKKAATIYQRSNDDGSFIVDDDGDLVVDSDFNSALKRIRSSNSAQYFDWLTEGQNSEETEGAWSVPISNVLADPDLTLDPKRYCRKVLALRNNLANKKFLTLGDIVEFISEKTDSNGNSIKGSVSQEYHYIEIADIGFGDFNSKKLRGWELPSRAKHFTEKDDIYFGAIWGSVSKWCYIGEGYDNHVVTNGCHRCRVKPGMEKYLTDLIAYMNTEGWATQLRSLARGSDGLAEVTQDDAKGVIIPLITNDDVRNEVSPFVENLKKGRVTVKAAISSLLSEDTWEIDEPTKRPSHIVLV
ncbi:N-6 DNA methylase [Vibrio parahaemolyticus]|uniref:N-6 DNA methylase n=1 Tax=Vibrio parahaemolyticus TaxID=670 RepID=UPI001D169C25|nr:N-6 DNA methylase [Vibrio parahaemolyticus]MCC3817313.1 N-6 DNA methylase [Vibrio parahaemolyticus]MCC3853907.1 N-6 DNA methylase [Vibrio parahaemolyticus]